MSFNRQWLQLDPGQAALILASFIYVYGNATLYCPRKLASKFVKVLQE